MTELTITPDEARKTARFKGTVAAGERVAVTVAGAAAWPAENLRLRVLGPRGETLAQFPPPDSGDLWTRPGAADAGDAGDAEDGGDATASGDLSCVLNLNTAQMLAAVPPGATLPFLVVLDALPADAADETAPTLYCKDRLEITHWPMRTGEDVPVDLDGYRDFVEETEARVTALENAVSLFTAKVESGVSAHEAAVASAIASKAEAAALDAETAAREQADAALATGASVNDAAIKSLAARFPVQTADIADAAVTTPKIADANVTEAKIKDEAVTRPKIGTYAVDASKLAGNAVTTPKIKDEAVTEAKLSADVRAALAKAGTALQSHQDLSGITSDIAALKAKDEDLEDADAALSQELDRRTTAFDLALSIRCGKLDQDVKALEGHFPVSTSGIADGAVTAAKLADEVHNLIGGIDAAAVAAQETANDAMSAAVAAQSTADDAKSAADDAKSAADMAQSAANYATDVANAAATNADAAVENLRWQMADAVPIVGKYPLVTGQVHDFQSLKVLSSSDLPRFSVAVVIGGVQYDYNVDLNDDDPVQFVGGVTPADDTLSLTWTRDGEELTFTVSLKDVLKKCGLLNLKADPKTGLLTAVADHSVLDYDTGGWASKRVFTARFTISGYGSYAAVDRWWTGDDETNGSDVTAHYYEDGGLADMGGAPDVTLRLKKAVGVSNTSADLYDKATLLLIDPSIGSEKYSVSYTPATVEIEYIGYSIVDNDAWYQNVFSTVRVTSDDYSDEDLSYLGVRNAAVTAVTIPVSSTDVMLVRLPAAPKDGSTRLARDFLVRADATAVADSTSLRLAAEEEDGALAALETEDGEAPSVPGGGVSLVSFTETAAGRFAVRVTPLVEAPAL